MTVQPVPEGRVVGEGGALMEGLRAFLNTVRRDLNGTAAGKAKWVEATVSAAAVASGGEVTVLSVGATETWKVRDLFITGVTSFDAGGDRSLVLTDGTTTWTTIAEASLEALSVSRWGDAGLPFPSALSTESAEGAAIVATLSGGSADYSSGSLTMIMLAERTK